MATAYGIQLEKGSNPQRHERHNLHELFAAMKFEAAQRQVTEYHLPHQLLPELGMKDAQVVTIFGTEAASTLHSTHRQPPLELGLIADDIKNKFNVSQAYYQFIEHIAEPLDDFFAQFKQRHSGNKARYNSYRNQTIDYGCRMTLVNLHLGNRLAQKVSRKPDLTNEDAYPVLAGMAFAMSSVFDTDYQRSARRQNHLGLDISRRPHT